MTPLNDLGPIVATARRSNLLTQEEERDLARRRDEGDHQARQELIERNIPLAVHLALRFSRIRPDRMGDNVGEASVALCRCADGYDPAKGGRFVAYAYPAIRRSLMLAHIREARPGAIRPRSNWVGTLQSLPDPASGHDEGWEDARVLSPELAGALGMIPDRWAEVIRRTYLVDSPETSAQIGARMGFTRQRVDQVRRSGLKLLRQILSGEDA